MDRLIKLLQREIESIDHNILTGACPDFTSYKEELARRRTFLEAIDIVKKVFVEDDDDDAS